ncbi:MAG: hypothetical protein K2P94_14335 [Rhodospirillaceae bacterium]|nr:hypothetical protein [Rhodospirillaceae bacterium]
MRGLIQSAWVSPLALTLYLAAIAHGIFSWNNRDRRPDLGIIDPPPSASTRALLSFGDKQFLYRLSVLNLQNDGDTGGRVTPLRDYNYDNVLAWLQAAQEMDPSAQHHLFLAARYFSQTSNTHDVRRLVAFIVDDVAKAPDYKWYWLTQAVSMAEIRLNDLPYALQIAQRLAAYNPPDAPHWVLMFPAVLLEKMGRVAEAEAVIENVRAQKQSVLTDDERLWIDDFIRRLHSPSP